MFPKSRIVHDFRKNPIYKQCCFGTNEYDSLLPLYVYWSECDGRVRSHFLSNEIQPVVLVGPVWLRRDRFAVHVRHCGVLHFGVDVIDRSVVAIPTDQEDPSDLRLVFRRGGGFTGYVRHVAGVELGVDRG